MNITAPLGCSFVNPLPWVLFVPACLLISFDPVHAQHQRAGWMWSSPGHPYGAVNILGSEPKENELISYFGAWNFNRVYTSVGSLPNSNPEVVANWNSTLLGFGIESQMLLGENTWIYPNVRPNLLSLLQTRFINFNNSRTNSQERFAGLHLDIEPQALSAWQNGTADKKELLFLLRDTYAEVRALLDDNGNSDVPIYADLPVWFDSSPGIGWSSSAERDQWFDDIADSLAGISLMAFERSSLNSMISGVSWEVQNFPGEVRVGLNAAEIAPGNTFPNYEAFDALAIGVADHFGSALGGIDYQPLYTFVDKAPSPEFDADFDGNGNVNGRDFLIWQRHHGTVSGVTQDQGDANGSGSVNAFDFQIWQQQYGPASLSTMVVPEPQSLALAFFGFLIMTWLPRSAKIIGMETDQLTCRSM